MPDPRHSRGRRHPLVFVLALAACAVLAGARSLTAIAEWAADAPPDLLIRLGGTVREPDTGPAAPAEATVRRILQRVDGNALDAAVGAWLADRDRAQRTTRPTLAVDGRTVRGAILPDGTQVHLLAAMSGSGLVLAQSADFPGAQSVPVLLEEGQDLAVAGWQRLGPSSSATRTAELPQNTHSEGELPDPHYGDAYDDHLVVGVRGGIGEPGGPDGGP